MNEPVVIGCSRCKRLVSLREEDLENFNKQNPFVCDECLNPKPVVEQPEQPQVQPNLDVGYVETPQEEQIRNTTIPLEVNEQTRSTKPSIPLGDGRRITGVTEPANHYIEEFNRRRERIEKELESERQRVEDYNHSSGGSSIAFVMAFIGAAVALIIGVLIFSAVSSEIDCESLTDSTELKQECNNAKDTAWTVIGILPVALFFAMLAMFGGFRSRG